MKDKTLLIMAAGMGSRFGGLKQIEPIGPNGEFIIDYSIYDAIKSGFTKVVFVIKEENYEVFKETIGNRVSKYINVDYAFQKMDNIPAGKTIPDGREKPWGTAHAILSAKDKIQGSFAVINSDDFYGRDAYQVLGAFLDEKEGFDWLCVGYLAKNTLSQSGPVKRGVCDVHLGELKKIVESKIEDIDGTIKAEPLSGDSAFEVQNDAMISMNMFGFSDKLFPILEEEFVNFFNNAKDITKDEFLIPNVIQKCIDTNTCHMYVLPTTAKWIGMTYKEDEEFVKNEINELISSGEYPNNLW